MLSFFRSEQMGYYELLIHREYAFDCMVELGIEGKVQFAKTDQEPGKMFKDELQRCYDLQRVLLCLQYDLEEVNAKTIHYPDAIDERPEIGNLAHIEFSASALNDQLHGVKLTILDMQIQHNKMLEKYHVLTKADEFLTGQQNAGAIMAWSDSIIMHLIHDELEDKRHNESLKLSFFAGSVPYDKFYHFELMLWRVCKGNFYIKHAELPAQLIDPNKWHGYVRKYVFMVFFFGDAMRSKIEKVCQGFKVTLFNCPESVHERMAQRQLITNDLADIKQIIERTEKQRDDLLYEVAIELHLWQVKFEKILKVYQQLNEMGIVTEIYNNQKYLANYVWIPVAHEQAVRSVLKKGANHSLQGKDGITFPPILTELPTKSTKECPTHIRTNKFTRGFQNLIDAYGTSSYQELNPGTYTIITFPFLFAVMFGDVGHGLILTVCGALMISCEERLERKQKTAREQNEIANILFAGRYIILLMGIFSMYTGLLYNDCFSKPLALFKSQWRVNVQVDKDTRINETECVLNPELKENYLGTPYIIGVDPIWYVATEDAIVFFNSLKMKLAIIIGVVHMMFGYSLGIVNRIYFKTYIDLCFELLPQIIFFVCLFAYLAFLIFYKWVMYGGHYERPYNNACAPSILLTFINMLLLKPLPEAPVGCNREMYPFQSKIQLVLVIIALSCIPIMLFGKPLILMHAHYKLKKEKNLEELEMKRHTLRSTLRPSVIKFVEGKVHKKEPPSHATESMGEVWLHSCIHTIEAVLGSISHTASYLRLWALSLAHNQLSHVLWKFLLKASFGENWLGALTVFVAFPCWAVLTVAVLVIMEGLSAFLHTLRLHWVEFQSKFFEGCGEIFRPFRFENREYF